VGSGQKSADRPVIAPDARVDVASIRAAIPYLSRMTSKSEGWRPASTRTESAGHHAVPASAAGHESARVTLSRWRHGFEPRWDYKRETPGQGVPASIGSLNRDSNAEYPVNNRTIEHSECAKGRARRGWMHRRRVAVRRLPHVCDSEQSRCARGSAARERTAQRWTR
jgi:hypothetical protein